MKCSYVPVDQVQGVWLEILPFVRKLARRADGRMTELSLFKECLSGAVHLWIVYDDDIEAKPIVAFIATKVREYPGKRMLSYEYIGGDRVEDWLGDADQYISDWSKSAGCQGVEAIGRLGWFRHLKTLNTGWTQEYTLYQRMFEESQ